MSYKTIVVKGGNRLTEPTCPQSIYPIHPKYPKAILPTASLLLLLLSSCTARTPENLSNLTIKTGASTATEESANGSPANGGMPPPVNKYAEHFDPDAEQAIGERSVHAWRIAVKHAKKPPQQETAQYQKQRSDDEKKAMEELGQLSKEYPSSSTVKFMQGQVEEHFGKNEEAYQFFKAAGANNRMNSVYMFKMAETERKAGHHAAAVAEYRKLLDHIKESGITADPAKLGLATSLLKLDPNSTEARKLVADVLASDPENKDAKLLAAGFQAASSDKSDKKGK